MVSKRSFHSPVQLSLPFLPFSSSHSSLNVLSSLHHVISVLFPPETFSPERSYFTLYLLCLAVSLIENSEKNSERERENEREKKTISINSPTYSHVNLFSFSTLFSSIHPFTTFLLSPISSTFLREKDQRDR